MRGDVWSRLHHLALNYRGKKLLLGTSQRDLLVVAYSLSRRRAVSRREMKKHIDDGLRSPSGSLDRIALRRDIIRMLPLISLRDRYYLSSRVTRLLYTLWTHGYAIHSSMNINLSCSIFGIRDLRRASLKEIENGIRKIIKNGYIRRHSFAEPFD